jgi:magnesium-transporting ATPase (P-type)
MITGDALQTAATIAQEVGILSKNADIKETCKTGAEFEAMSDKEKK